MKKLKYLMPVYFTFVSKPLNFWAAIHKVLLYQAKQTSGEPSLLDCECKMQ